MNGLINFGIVAVTVDLNDGFTAVFHSYDLDGQPVQQLLHFDFTSKEATYIDVNGTEYSGTLSE